MARFLAGIISLSILTGCVAVPALEKRMEIRTQVQWVEERCPSTRGPNGPVVDTDNAKDVPLELVPGDEFTCGSITVHRDAIRAFGENNIPREPNKAEWVAAYIVDAIITILAIPVVIVAVGASLNSGNSGSTGMTGAGTSAGGGAWSCAAGTCSGAGPSGAWAGNGVQY